MRLLERIILAAGLLTIATLVWRFKPASVWAQVSGIGAGFWLVLAFQICDHALNALGWLYAFSAKDAPDIPFWCLVKIRIAGDGVNYLTPSGQIAGEFVRPGMLGGLKPEEVKNASVVVAKFTQSLAQALFIFLGLVLVVQGRLDFLPRSQRALGLGAALLTMGLVLVSLWILASEPSPGRRPWQAQGSLAPLRAVIRRYLREHPGRFSLSTLFFMAGYAWGALEVLLICALMGIPMPLLTALSVEVLSNVVDSLLFMVPAKAGTQEAGKVAIFHGLGYPAGSGLAFGLIRHCRELAWAAAGLLLYTLSRRAAGPAAAQPESPQPRAEPLVPAG